MRCACEGERARWLCVEARSTITVWRLQGCLNVNVCTNVLRLYRLRYTNSTETYYSNLFSIPNTHPHTHTHILTQSVCVPTTVAWYMEIHFIFIECITKNLDTFYIRNATVVEAAAAAGTSTTSTQKHIETEFQQCDLCDVIQPFSLFLLTLFVCALFGAVHKICFWILFVRFLFFNKFDVSSSPRIRISSWV